MSIQERIKMFRLQAPDGGVTGSPSGDAGGTPAGTTTAPDAGAAAAGEPAASAGGNASAGAALPAAGGQSPPGFTGGQAPPPAPNPPAQTFTVEQYAQLQQQYIQAQEQLRRDQQYAQYGQQVYAQQVQAQREKQEQERRQQSAPKFWELPKYDQELFAGITRDPNTGDLVAPPGSPPDTLQRYRQFQSKLSETQLGFFTDPAKYLMDPVAKMVEERAGALFDQRMQAYRAEQQAQQTVQQNMDWMMATSADGSRQWTPEGLVYRQTVKELADAGVPLALQNHYATMAAQNAVLMQQHRGQAQQQTAQQGHQAANQAFLRPNGVNQPQIGGAGATAQPPKARNFANVADLQKSIADQLKAAGETLD